MKFYMKILLIFISCTGTVLAEGCRTGEFECKFSHTCVPGHQKCNGVPDCPHAEDEHACPPKCRTDEFACDDLCISMLFYCDGHYDCSDKSDESFCPEIRKNHTCPPDHFTCTEGTCIPMDFVCDGHPDCLDDADEKTCSGPIIQMDRDCPPPNYKCEDGEETCIAERYVCDGEKDCVDGSDEMDCGEMKQHHDCLPAQGMFACNKSSEYDLDIRCIPSDQVCNGKPQCPNGEDEGKICSEKLCPGKGCEHQCMETSKGPVCFCYPGFTLGADGRSCEDVDECQEFGTCSQICRNTKGGYECDCLAGYSLVNKTSCQSVGSAQIFITLDSESSGEIRSYDLHTREYLLIAIGVEKPVGVDYDAYNNRLFWTDASLGRSLVEQAEILKNGSAGGKQAFLETGLEHPEDLVIDPHSGLVYFSDSGKGRVAACSIISAICTIISEGHLQPRGLALHSKYRLLFVTEWGRNPQIVRMNMDGSAQKSLINTNIVWPNGIAVDESMDRIYWTDAHRDTIESAKIDGSDRRLVVSDVFHPFGVAVFEDSVYWSDWHDYRLFSCNKFTGKNIRVLLETPSRMNGISLHSSMPVVISDPCAKSTCSHLCIPFGSIVGRDGRSDDFSCKCPENMYLKSDGISCEINYFKNPLNSLVVASGNSLYSLKPQTLGKLNLEPVGFETGIVNSLSSFIMDDNLVATTSVGQVLSVNTRQKSSQLLSVESETKSLAHAYIQGNLFWIDSVKKSIVIMSEKSKQIKTLIKCANPKALTYVHGKNIIAFIDGTSLLEASVNGQKTSLLAGKLPATANSLIFSELLKTYYIGAEDGIYSYTLGLGSLDEVVTVDSYPVSMTVQEGYLYWTEMDSKYLSWTNVKRHEEDQSVLKILLNIPGNNQNFISATARMPQYAQGACAFQHCSDICVRSEVDVAYCLCGDGRSLIEDGAWNKCMDDTETVSEERNAHEVEEYRATMIGMIVSMSLVLGSVLVLLVCCCTSKRRKLKSVEFINRSFGLSSPPMKTMQNQEMSSIEVLSTGLRTEVENPGLYTVNIQTPGQPQPLNPFHAADLLTSDQAKVTQRGLPGIINKIRRFRDPKMCALDWAEGSVAYENLDAAKGSSTPSLKKRLRMETIEERDSAYSAGSLDCSDECNMSSDHTQLVG